MYTDIDFFNYLQKLQENINFKTYPKSKEQMYYKKMFDRLFPNTSNIIEYFWEHLW